MSRKSKFWLGLMRIYVRLALKRNFNDVLVRGLDETREKLGKEPLILAANHVSWWDPLALILLDQALNADGYGLMASESITELPFFSRLGALPLDRSHPRASLRDLERAAPYLNKRGRFVAIFPSGRQAPAHFPLKFHAGAVWLHERTSVDVVPLAVRYEFLESPRPTLLLSLGPPLILDRPRAQALHDLEARVRAELSKIDDLLLSCVEPTRPPADLGFRSLLYRTPRGLRQDRIPRSSRILSWISGLSGTPTERPR